MLIDCRHCLGCRVETAADWAVRAQHEAQMHAQSCFATLTYDAAHYPANGSLVKRDTQLFWKRLRDHDTVNNPLSYLLCGEYGSRTLRAHYHAGIFGYDFPDKKKYKTTDSGDTLYESKIADALWGHGKVILGNISYHSANYIARYTTGKQGGKFKAGHYQRINPATGERYSVEPEFLLSSTTPAIGKRWFDKYWKDVYPADFVLYGQNNTKRMPPPYYDLLLSRAQPDIYEAVKAARILRAETDERVEHENSPARLRTREFVKRAKLNLYNPRATL
jgi:hypothetical protein